MRRHTIEQDRMLAQNDFCRQRLPQVAGKLFNSQSTQLRTSDEHGKTRLLAREDVVYAPDTCTTSATVDVTMPCIETTVLISLTNAGRKSKWFHLSSQSACAPCLHDNLQRQHTGSKYIFDDNSTLFVFYTANNNVDRIERKDANT